MSENAVDVSSYQGGTVGWTQVAAAGIAVAICKSSESTGWTDPTFAPNWTGIKAAGMRRGAYHFAGGRDPAAEVDHFLSVVTRDGPLDPSDTLWLDLEANAGPAWGLQFMQLLTARRGGDPSRNGIYSGRWYIDQTGGPGAWQGLTRWPYWFSAYTPRLDSAALAPWSSCVLWQNTSSAQIPGVPGACDASIIQNAGYFAAPGTRPQSVTLAAPSEEDMPPVIVTLNAGPHAGVKTRFRIGKAGNLVTSWQVADPSDPASKPMVGGAWHPWVSLGGTKLASGVTVEQDERGALSAYVDDTDYGSFTTWQDHTGGTWHPLTPAPAGTA